MSEICYEPSQIFQPSEARAAPSRLGPPIRLLRSCPVFDALDLSEPEDLGESGPFEERSAPRTKADLLREIRQRADRRTGQQEAEQRQIDPWQVQPPQRRGHGR